MPVILAWKRSIPVAFKTGGLRGDNVVSSARAYEAIDTMLTKALTKDKLRNARRRATLAPSELGDKSDVGITSITRIKGGHITEHRVLTLRKLTGVLDVESRDLLKTSSFRGDRTLKITFLLHATEQVSSRNLRRKGPRNPRKPRPRILRLLRARGYAADPF